MVNTTHLTHSPRSPHSLCNSRTPLTHSRAHAHATNLNTPRLAHAFLNNSVHHHHYFTRRYLNVHELFYGVLTVLEAEWQDFCIMNWKTPLGNLDSRLWCLGNMSWWGSELTMETNLTQAFKPPRQGFGELRNTRLRTYPRNGSRGIHIEVVMWSSLMPRVGGVVVKLRSASVEGVACVLSVLRWAWVPGLGCSQADEALSVSWRGSERWGAFVMRRGLCVRREAAGKLKERRKQLICGT